jgi:hypothetical protein
VDITWPVKAAVEGFAITVGGVSGLTGETRGDDGLISGIGQQEIRLIERPKIKQNSAIAFSGTNALLMKCTLFPRSPEGIIENHDL